MTPRGGVSPSSKQVKLGENYGDLPTPTAPTGHTFGGWYLDGAAVTSTTQNTTIGDHTLTANWVAICYASDLNIYNPSGSADGASGTCNITYVKNGITYASGTNTTNETWSWNSDIFPYGTVITVSNITIPTGRKLSKVVIGGQTISGSNGVYTYTMTGNANVLIYTQYNTYTIYFDRQSGSGGSSSATATYNSTVPNISVPSRTGYTFGGYYTGTGGSGTQYYNSSGYGTRTWTSTSNTTLYAKWNAIATTISASATTVSYYPVITGVYGSSYTWWQNDSGSTTITAGGGGGKWTYSVVSTSRSTSSSEYSFDSNRGNPASSNGYSLSTTSATTGSVTLTCKCLPAFIVYEGDRTYYDATYTYVIRATSAYNGTYADITIKFKVSYYSFDDD